MMPLFRTFAYIDKKVPVTKRPEDPKLLEQADRPVGVDFHVAGRYYRLVGFVSLTHKGTLLINIRDQG